MTTVKLKDEFIKKVASEGLPVGETTLGLRLTYVRKSIWGSTFEVSFVLPCGDEVGSLGEYTLAEGSDLTLLNLRGAFEISISNA